MNLIYCILSTYQRVGHLEGIWILDSNILIHTRIIPIEPYYVWNQLLNFESETYLFDVLKSGTIWNRHNISDSHIYLFIFRILSYVNIDTDRE